MLKFKIAGLSVDKVKREIYAALRKYEEDADYFDKVATALYAEGLFDFSEAYRKQAQKQWRRARNAGQILATVCKARPQIW